MYVYPTPSTDALLTLPEIDFVEEEEGDDEDCDSSWTPSTALDLEVQSIPSPLTDSDPPLATVTVADAADAGIAACPAYREAVPVDAGDQASGVEDVAVDVPTSFPGGGQTSSLEDAVVDVSTSFPGAVECHAAAAAFVCDCLLYTSPSPRD